MGSVSVVEVNIEVCVPWLAVCSALELGISVVDEINFDVLCPSVAVEGEDGDVPVEDDVVSSVELLSLVDDSIVVVVIGDIAVVNVD